MAAAQTSVHGAMAESTSGQVPCDLAESEQCIVPRNGPLSARAERFRNAVGSRRGGREPGTELFVVRARGAWRGTGHWCRRSERAGALNAMIGAATCSCVGAQNAARMCARSSARECARSSARYARQVPFRFAAPGLFSVTRIMFALGNAFTPEFASKNALKSVRGVCPGGVYQRVSGGCPA